MGKLVIFILALTLLVNLASPVESNAKAGKKFSVKVTKCVDGDTAWFSKVGKTRFLYVDTPESTNKIQPYGKTASNYTCSKLKNAKKIQLQYDGVKTDKYGRVLAWVWVDNKLLQKQLVQKGYVKGFYDYGNYSYESSLLVAQKKAKNKKVGIWSNPSKNLIDLITTTKKKTSIKKTTTATTLNFKNCTELRKVYPNGVKKGHPAYQSKMDRDKDNFACES